MEGLTVGTYQEFKQQLDTEITKQAESFVITGYLLRIAQDTDILRESGYKDAVEFAKAEYGLDKTQVSRYIRINEKYSEGGYSDKLQDKYKGFGYSKLAEMLTLPEQLVDALSPDMTRQQIQDVKSEYKEEKQITDLEIMIEEKKQEQQELKTDLQRFVHQYGYDYRENFRALANAVACEDYIDKLLDIIAPSGVNMLSVRIKGQGKKFLSIKGKDEKLVLVDARTNDSFGWLWEDLRDDIKEIYGDGSKLTWELIYCEPFEKGESEVEEKEPVKQEEKAAVQEQHDSERKEIDAKNRDDKEGSVSGSDKQLGEQIEESGMIKKEEDKQTVQDGGAVQDGGDRIVKLKQECATEEIKDELFDIWFDNVAEEKIKAACKIMSTMRFADLINSTPRKLFLLAQTSEITTEEVKQNGELLTKVEDSSQTALFTAQDFLKRFTKKFLDPYKEKIQQSAEVALAQQEKTKEGIAILAECVYAVIKQYREKLMNLSEYTVDTVKDTLDKTTMKATWVEFDVEGVSYEAQVDAQRISEMEEVVIYKANSTEEEYVWFIDEVYEEIARVINFEGPGIFIEEQIPGQMQVSDYPEIQPESREAQPLKQSDYITMSFRCLPKDIVYFIAKNRVEEAIVTQITIEENWIPQIEVKTTDPNTLIVAEFDEKEDWGKILFKSKSAAEKALEEHLTLEEQENK